MFFICGLSLLIDGQSQYHERYQTNEETDLKDDYEIIIRVSRITLKIKRIVYKKRYFQNRKASERVLCTLQFQRAENVLLFSFFFDKKNEE